jgi:hypothetical protein
MATLPLFTEDARRRHVEIAEERGKGGSESQQPFLGVKLAWWCNGFEVVQGIDGL